MNTNAIGMTDLYVCCPARRRSSFRYRSCRCHLTSRGGWSIPGVKTPRYKIVLPMALIRGGHKTSIPKSNAIGMTDVVAPGFIPVNQCYMNTNAIGMADLVAPAFIPVGHVDIVMP